MNLDPCLLPYREINFKWTINYYRQDMTEYPHVLREGKSFLDKAEGKNNERRN